MEVNHSSLVHEESSSTASISTAKEEKLLPGICLPTEEEKINDEVEKAAEVLEELEEDTKLGRNSSKVTNGGSQESTNADVKYLRKVNHNFAVTLGEAKVILGMKIRGRTRSQERSTSLKRRSVTTSMDARKPKPGNTALKRKRR